MAVGIWETVNSLGSVSEVRGHVHLPGITRHDQRVLLSESTGLYDMAGFHKAISIVGKLGGASNPIKSFSKEKPLHQ